MIFLLLRQCWLTHHDFLYNLFIYLLILHHCLRFEKYRDPIPALQWCQARPWIPIVAVTLYALFLYIGPKMMEVSTSCYQEKKLRVLQTPPLILFILILLLLMFFCFFLAETRILELAQCFGGLEFVPLCIFHNGNDPYGTSCLARYANSIYSGQYLCQSTWIHRGRIDRTLDVPLCHVEISVSNRCIIGFVHSILVFFYRPRHFPLPCENRSTHL